MRFITLYLFVIFMAGICCYSPVKAAVTTLKGNDPAVRYTGRTLVAPDGSVSFDWAGTYWETRLTGGNLSVKVSETGKSYYNVFVDGKLHKIVTVTGTDTLINMVSGLGKKMHQLRIQKRSEGGFGKTTLHQFILPASGHLLPEPVTRTRHIEFIGNSITCGYGTDGKNRDEPFLVETENCNKSFATIIARYYDTDYTLIAHSGKGAVRNYGDSVRVSKVTMKDRMMNTFDEDLTIKWDFTRYRPELVVVNLGLNDFSHGPNPHLTEFVAAYKQIIFQIRENYGDIPVLCLFPVGMPDHAYPYYEVAMAEVNDPKVQLLRLKKDLYNKTTDLGSGWHPGYQGQLKMAMWIIPYISTLTGWNLSGKVIE